MIKEPENLTRDEALFIIAHELGHRLLEIEPGSISIGPDGQGSMFPKTDEGQFLADTITMIDAMRGIKQPEHTADCPAIDGFGCRCNE